MISHKLTLTIAVLTLLAEPGLAQTGESDEDVVRDSFGIVHPPYIETPGCPPGASNCASIIIDTRLGTILTEQEVLEKSASTWSDIIRDGMGEVVPPYSESSGCPPFGDDCTPIIVDTRSNTTLTDEQVEAGTELGSDDNVRNSAGQLLSPYVESPGCPPGGTDCAPIIIDTVANRILTEQEVLEKTDANLEDIVRDKTGHVLWPYVESSGCSPDGTDCSPIIVDTRTNTVLTTEQVLAKSEPLADDVIRDWKGQVIAPYIETPGCPPGGTNCLPIIVDTRTNEVIAVNDEFIGAEPTGNGLEVKRTAE